MTSEKCSLRGGLPCAQFAVAWLTAWANRGPRSQAVPRAMLRAVTSADAYGTVVRAMKRAVALTDHACSPSPFTDLRPNCVRYMACMAPMVSNVSFTTGSRERGSPPRAPRRLGTLDAPALHV